MPYKNPEDRTAYFARTLEHRREVHRAWAARKHAERTLYAAKWRETNREQIRAGDRRRYHADIETTRTKKRTKYAKTAATICARRRAQRAANPEEARAKDHARRWGDPEKSQAKDAKRRHANGAHIDAMARARRAANPEPFRMSDRKRHGTPKRKLQAQTAKRNRRAHKTNAPICDLTHAQWLEIQEAQDHRCYYCGKRYKGKLTQDHIRPLTQGGSHTLHNVIGACHSCNSRKGTRPPPIPVQPLLLTLAPAKKKKAS